MSDVWVRGDWMQTYSGRKFYPLDPHPEDIYIEDIAHALSLICRYGGHVDHFYSVAEHCVLMSNTMEGDDALWALLHDASEAYVGDMVRPLKHQMPEYMAAEEKVIAAVAKAFDLPTDMYSAAVIDADNRILLDERAALMKNKIAGDWNVDGMEPLGVEIRGYFPLSAERLFLQRFKELTGGGL